MITGTYFRYTIHCTICINKWTEYPVNAANHNWYWPVQTEQNETTETSMNSWAVPTAKVEVE